MGPFDWSEIFIQWSGPLLAGLGTIIVGAIIWGIQLNYAVLRHTGLISTLQKQATDSEKALQKQITDHRIESQTHYMQIAKTALLLDELEKRMETMDSEWKTHSEKSEGWRHRVVALEERVKNR